MLPWLPDGIWTWVLTSVLGIIGYVIYVLLSSSGSEFEDNSIDAFIIQEDTSSKKEKNVNLGESYPLWTYDTEGKQILILYGTEYGFSEEVATKLFHRVVALVQPDDDSQIQPRLVNMKHHKFVDLSREQLCFVVISTSGDGVPPTDARGFYDDLMSRDEKLSNLRFSVLALGDSNYPHFCKTGRDVKARLLQLCGKSVIESRDVDMEDWTIIDSWMDDIISYIQSCDLRVDMDYLHIVADGADDGYDRHRPFMATLKVKNLMTAPPRSLDDKEVIHCEFDITGSELSWTSGDALGIYPENNPDHVTAVLNTLNWSDSEMFSVPHWAYQPHSGTANLRTLLEKYYDIKSVKPDLLQSLMGTVVSTDQRERLSWLLQEGTGKSNRPLQQYISAREVRDVLEEFTSGTLLPRQLLSCLKPLQPRYYSISSSPLKDPTSVCVCVAVIRYEMLSLSRQGVTTTYLKDRVTLGQSCPVFISRNQDFRLPSNPATPVILIGPGTGIAPFRAFIQERGLSSDGGKMYLYYGCRHKMNDYLYKDELEQYSREGMLCLRVAFSRDQARKVYVQDLLQEDRSLIRQLLINESGHIYVCGDARYMAKDVHQTLTDILQSCSQSSENVATDYLKKLEFEKRYQRDVWVT